MTVHSHGEGEGEARVLRSLLVAIELSVLILLIEAAGAYFSRSLSLTVDAVHNVPDILAFLLSWTAVRASRQGARGDMTFGAHRWETFAGLLNAILVLGTGLVFGYEAVTFLVRGGSFAGPVDPLWILAVAVPTIGLRSANLALLGRIPNRVRDLNLRSVVVHLASDLAITASLLGAGVVLLLAPRLGWVDPAAALVIGGMLVVESLPLFRDGWDILTEKAPRGVSMEAIAASAVGVPGVRGIHDVHVWSVCSSLVCLMAHVDIDDMSLSDSRTVVAELRRRVERDFGIVHSTFEVEGPSTPEPGVSAST